MTTTFQPHGPNDEWFPFYSNPNSGYRLPLYGCARPHYLTIGGSECAGTGTIWATDSSSLAEELKSLMNAEGHNVSTTVVKGKYRIQFLSVDTFKYLGLPSGELLSFLKSHPWG